MWIYLITGGEWWFVPSDDPDKLPGPDYGYGLIEEASTCLNQQAIWEVILPTFRARPDFVVVLPTTPRPHSYLVQHCLERLREGDTDYWSSKQTSYVNSFLAKEFWETMRKELSPEMFAQEIEAEMVAAEGAVYGRHFLNNTCNDDLEGGNVIHLDPAKTTRKAPQRYHLIGGIDWGTGYNTFLAIVRDTVADIDIICDEMCLDGMTVEQSTYEIAKRIKEYPQRLGLEMHSVYTDPNGKEWNTSLKRKVPGTCRVIYTWIKEFTAIHTSVEIVSRRILDAAGRRRLFISRDVVAMTQSGPGGRGIYQGITGGYRYSKIIKTGAFRPEPHKDGKFDHSCDALRYALVNTYYSVLYKT